MNRRMREGKAKRALMRVAVDQVAGLRLTAVIVDEYAQPILDRHEALCQTLCDRELSTAEAGGMGDDAALA